MNHPRKDVRIQLRLPSDLLALLRARADEMDWQFSDFIRAMMDAYTDFTADQWATMRKALDNAQMAITKGEQALNAMRKDYARSRAKFVELGTGKTVFNIATAKRAPQESIRTP